MIKQLSLVERTENEKALKRVEIKAKRRKKSAAWIRDLAVLNAKLNRKKGSH